jgi:predicted dehydrogenase
MDHPSPLRLLLVGCGQIARVHLGQLTQNPQWSLSAVVDPDPRHRQALIANHPHSPGDFDSLAQALPALSVDAALICTPTHLHFEQVMQLWDAGIPVLCEKPLVDTRERLVDILAQVPRRPPLMIAYQRRQSAVFREARELVRTGRLGRLKSISLVNTEHWAQTIGGTWRDDPRQNPGGFLGDAGSHKLDMLFFLTGLRPERVLSRCQTLDWNVPVSTQAIIEFEEAVVGNLSFTGNAHHYYEEFRLHGTDADLVIRPTELLLARANRMEPVSIPGTDSNPTEAFAEFLRGKTSNPAPSQVAMAVRDLTDAILASAAEGRTIEM